jgi:hypothetical protein
MELRKNKILELHAQWLWTNGYIKQSIECLKQSKFNNARPKIGRFKQYVTTTNGVGATNRVPRS